MKPKATMQLPLPEVQQYVRENSAPYLNYSEFNRSPAHRVRLAGIIQMLDKAIPDRREKLIEIGCGVGNIAIPIASLGYNVTACDIHEPSVVQARQRNPFGNLQFIHGSIDRLNLGEYDAVILTEVLEHVKNYREMIAVIIRSMKKESTLIITVPNGWGIAELLCRPSYVLKSWPGGEIIIRHIKHFLKTADLTTANFSTPHVHFFTLGRLVNLFKDHNLIITSFRRCFFLWPLWEIFFSQRGYPSEWPANDFIRSQKLPPALCAFWIFSLKKGS